MKRSEVRVGMRVYASESQRDNHPERQLEVAAEPHDVPGSLEGAVLVCRPGTQFITSMFINPLVAAEEK